MAAPSRPPLLTARAQQCPWAARNGQYIGACGMIHGDITRFLGRMGADGRQLYHTRPPGRASPYSARALSVAYDEPYGPRTAGPGSIFRPARGPRLGLLGHGLGPVSGMSVSSLVLFVLRVTHGV